MTKYKKGEIVSYNSFDKINYLKIETIIDNGEGNPYYEDIDGTGILESDIISNRIVFEFNNWFRGKDYPPIHIVDEWMSNYQLRSDDFAEKNDLVIMTGPIDMSSNYIVNAPITFVEQFLPELLTDDTYTYEIITRRYNPETKDYDEESQEYTKKYSDFVLIPDKYGDVSGKIADDWYMEEYKPEDVGVHWNNSWWGDECDDDDNDEDDE